MNGASSSGAGGVPMGVPVMGGQPMAMVPNAQGMAAQGKPGAPNQNVLDAVKKVSVLLKNRQCSEFISF
jgi:PAB1-binding protein PBP1